MAERVLVPINEKMQVKNGWSQRFSELDVYLRADNPVTNAWISHELIGELRHLGGRVVSFTTEFDREAIPKQFDIRHGLDLSLGSPLVRLATGSRLSDATGYSSRIETLYGTARNLAYETWVFDAEQLEEYVPPVVVHEEPKPRRKSLFSWT